MAIVHNVLSRPFQAEWPESLKPNLVSKAAWKVFSLLLYPVNWIRKQIIINMVIPALQHEESPQFERWRQNLGGERISFKTPDGETLDGMIFKGTAAGKAIIYAPGNGGTYEKSGHTINFLKETGATVMVFNRRGVLHSTGFPWREGLAVDVYSAYEYLNKMQGIDPENVVGYGLSMGGSDINRGAALVQEKYANRRMKVVNDRSYSDFAAAAGSFLGRMISLPGISFLARFLIQLLQLQIDSKEAWDSLKGRKSIIYHKLDGLIGYEASLYKAVKKDNHGTVTRIRMLQPDSRELLREYHNRLLNRLEQKAVIKEIKLMLDIHNTESPDPAVDGLVKYLKHR